MSPTHSPSRVLLVDNSAVAERVAAVLSSGGWEVLRAEQPEEAFDAARRLKTDVILLNVDLGLAASEDLVKRLKLEPMTCSIPILATATAHPAYARQAGAWGVDWLAWPSEPYALAAKLQRLVANRRRHGPYVLIVDDEPDLVEIMTTGLSQHGFLTASATNGIEAIESARCAQPDAILLDLDMPRLNGWEVLEQLRHHPSLISVPIVILTGAARTEIDRRVGLANGANAYLTKPCSIEEVANTLTSVMKRG
ncbi:MAG: response regulator [Candidatus Omnitrophica bacterium]|nr:response regulator [Candidatus Omnitrophota bacterium]